MNEPAIKPGPDRRPSDTLGYTLYTANRRLNLHYINFPPELEPAFRELVDDCAWIFPQWISALSIGFYESHPDGDSAAMECTLFPNDRSMRISVFGRLFIGYSRDERRQMLLHEFLHGHVNIIYNWAVDQLKRLVETDAPKYYATLKDELLSRVEQVVQDLSIAIAGHRPPSPEAKP